MSIRSKRISSKVEMNVVPYIDVMLVLLIIFMIAAPLIQQSVEVELPKVSKSETIEASDAEPLILSVDKDGQFFLSVEEDGTKAIELKQAAQIIKAEIIIAKEQGKQLPVFIRGDRHAPYDYIMRGMSAMKAAGIEKVGLMTDAPESV